MKFKKVLSLLTSVAVWLTLCSCSAQTADSANSYQEVVLVQQSSTTENSGVSFELDSVPDYSGEPYVILNGNTPYFDNEDLSSLSFEAYSELDALGRAGVCIASIGIDIMPTEDRGDISSVYPTGWNQNAYDFVDGGYIYNRCHLIGYQLTGENANPNNLITGTRYMNVAGMLVFENMIADYLDKNPDNHVYYQVTPVFDGDNLLASGVLLEAKSVEDIGEGLMFCVYCYNVEPGVTIDYATGRNCLDGEEFEDESIVMDFVLNTSSMKIHLPECSSVESMSEKNKEFFTGSLEELYAEGYTCCGNCL